MKITSLARQTDLIFHEYDGEVLDRGNYVAIRTPKNPGYHWGNYLIFSLPPNREAVTQWPCTGMIGKRSPN
jgi:hypothetical protein